MTQQNTLELLRNKIRKAVTENLAVAAFLRGLKTVKILAWQLLYKWVKGGLGAAVKIEGGTNDGKY